MKNIKYIILFIAIATVSCKKNIDLLPQSNTTISEYYTNFKEISIALTGCYSGLQKSLLKEWQLTELRSDNVVMGAASSKSIDNFLLSDFDVFVPSTSHPTIYDYWLSTYNNIRNTNLVLNSLGVNYNELDGTISYDPISIPVTLEQRQKLAAEASFIRAYHYFNLVRLFGGVFLIHEPIFPDNAKLINRTSVSDVYKLIIEDLNNAVINGNKSSFANTASTDLGRVNTWAAKALLAKVYLTLNKKNDATNILKDVISNSGYSLQSSYANVFSVNNEMNSEILFAIRYKAGGLNLGSPFPNQFAPARSGSAIVNGDGNGWNYPAIELYDSMAYIKSRCFILKDSNFITLRSTPSTAFPITVGLKVIGPQIAAGTTVTAVNGKIVYLSSKNLARDSTSNALATFYIDKRLEVNIGQYAPNGSSSLLYYPKKHISYINLIDDGENDWPVLRFSDVLLMLAEAQGNSPTSIALINQTRERAGLPNLSTTLSTVQFERALSKERRFELAFENQRFFDLIRYNTTMTTITAEQTLKDHFALMYPLHYKNYPSPTPPLSTLQGYIKSERMLLPIPQREIDNNTRIVIPQNPGY
jgi:hypothetical protein